MMLFEPDLLLAHAAAVQPQHARVGFDLAQVSPIAESIRRFGSRFRDRLFTRSELDYADSGPDLAPQRLAARFAAKEAVIKALNLSEAGVNWRDIEVTRWPTGECTISLHGRAAQLAASMGVEQLLLSLSHDGDYAGAIVTVRLRSTPEKPINISEEQPHENP